MKRALRCSDDFAWISTGGELNEPRRNRNNHCALFSGREWSCSWAAEHSRCSLWMPLKYKNHVNNPAHGFRQSRTWTTNLAFYLIRWSQCPTACTVWWFQRFQPCTVKGKCKYRNCVVFKVGCPKIHWFIILPHQIAILWLHRIFQTQPYDSHMMPYASHLSRPGMPFHLASMLPVVQLHNG